jgi:hypothetical protein
MRAFLAGTKLPIWASNVNRATWRMNVLLPDMFGPVMSQRMPSSGPRRPSLGTKVPGDGGCAANMKTQRGQGPL